MRSPFHISTIKTNHSHVSRKYVVINQCTDAYVSADISKITCGLKNCVNQLHEHFNFGLNIELALGVTILIDFDLP